LAARMVRLQVVYNASSARSWTHPVVALLEKASVEEPVPEVFGEWAHPEAGPLGNVAHL